jgi:SMODS and SLOG-associating 2TM effector domain 1
MTERADQFAELYEHDRFRDQLEWYQGRRQNAERSRDQAIHMKWILSTLAALAGSVGAAVPAWRTDLAIAAAFLAAAATALTAYQSLYAFPRLAKLYLDAENSLAALNAAELAFRPGLPTAETRALVERMENVFARENNQWGQLTQHAVDEPDPK